MNRARLVSLFFVSLQDGRQLVGRFMAFDRHMNLVLGDAEEFRKLPPKKGSGDAERESRRPLGFLLVRGEEIISLTIEGPPPSEHRTKKEGAVRRPRFSVNPTGPSNAQVATRSSARVHQCIDVSRKR